MGRSMFDFGKQGKERARQQKQMDKASKRLIAKRRKATIQTGPPDADTTIAAQPLSQDGDVAMPDVDCRHGNG